MDTGAYDIDKRLDAVEAKLAHVTGLATRTGEDARELKGRLAAVVDQQQQLFICVEQQKLKTETTADIAKDTKQIAQEVASQLTTVLVALEKVQRNWTLQTIPLLTAVVGSMGLLGVALFQALIK